MSRTDVLGVRLGHQETLVWMEIQDYQEPQDCLVSLAILHLSQSCQLESVGTVRLDQGVHRDLLEYQVYLAFLEWMVRKKPNMFQ